MQTVATVLPALWWIAGLSVLLRELSTLLCAMDILLHRLRPSAHGRHQVANSMGRGSASSLFLLSLRDARSGTQMVAVPAQVGLHQNNWKLCGPMGA